MRRIYCKNETIPNAAVVIAISKQVIGFFGYFSVCNLRMKNRKTKEGRTSSIIQVSNIL